MLNNEKLEKLLAGKWSDKYLCRLCVLDHLRDCLEKDNHLKATDSPKDSAGYMALDKELMDLRIVLELYFAGRDELADQRLDKYLANMNK